MLRSQNHSLHVVRVTLLQTGELEMPKAEMSATRMERMRRFVLGRPLAEVNGAASSPVDRPPLTPPKKARGAPPRK